MATLPPATIWCNVPLAPQSAEWLRGAVTPHRLVISKAPGASNLVAGGPEEECRTADIAFGQPDPSDVTTSSALKWIHLTSAGYTRYDNDEVRAGIKGRGATMTNSSGVYDDPCAQHALAFLLGSNRQLHPSQDRQKEGRWSYGELRPFTRVLRDDKVLIVGFGAIAIRLVELLVPFGVEIRGIKRTVTGAESAPCHPIEDLSNHLPWADIVINILPASPATQGLFTKEIFSQFKKGTVFVNIGRGDTVNQDALISALATGQITSASLDVTNPEPLPSDHPLWSAPNLHITPHIAGGLQEEEQELLNHFVRNLRRWEQGETLLNRII